ncbi:DUF636 domain protein [Penicillium argentinense]|uniref:DUF636 domain protein n=1 Tax=Penicillium argentinense TaxID=1131581 RepID=A0A9W9KDS8_9EURO|nr:DUF636 domain protein [Penicillium argentinense]KAJ5102674.1 DUF636 domain protein [Penicillium argentinense]
MPLTGHCLCEAVSYVANVAEPDLVAYCHCDDCQRQSGSTYSLAAFLFIVPKDKVTINGHDRTFSSPGSSGYAVLCQSCP